MTKDYKKILINYFTKLLNRESPKTQDDKITAINGIEYNSNDWQFIIDAFSGTYSAVIHGILENEKYDTFIMYGAYQTSNGGNTNGFLIYLDRNGKPLKIRKLNTRGILNLNFDPSSNRVYGVISNSSVYYTTPTPYENYFVYFNNLFLTIDDIIPVNLTYSYKYYSSNSTILWVQEIIKDPEGSNYLIFSSERGTPLTDNQITELKINVGSANEIQIWSFPNKYNCYANYGSFSSNECNFKCIVYDRDNSKFQIASKNNTSISYTDISITGTLRTLFNFRVEKNYSFINENTIYFTCPDIRQSGGYNYYRTNLIKYNGSNLKVIYSTPEGAMYDDGFTTQKNCPFINLVKDIDNTLYAFEFISDEDANKTTVNLCNITANPNVDDWINGIYEANNVYRGQIFNQYSFARRNYNILNLFTFSGYFTEPYGRMTGVINGFQLNIQNLKPIGKYVGDEYVDVDALVPSYTNLYNNNNLLFSRNQYNISIQENMTMSSVEIPNNYLNDITIDLNDLIGNTNYILNRNWTNWTKNIYEVVDLNFLNTITMIDEDTNTKNQLGASKINGAISSGTESDYTNSPCTKYRINYQDNTNSISNIYWKSINDTNKQTIFTIHVDKAIKDIDLLSNDENTIYQKINGTFELDKDYTIKQKVRVGKKPIEYDLVYNNQNVLYENKQVQIQGE